MVQRNQILKTGSITNIPRINFLEWAKLRENHRELAQSYTGLLRDVPQDPTHHPEGNALNHIRLVRKSIPKAVQELKTLQQSHPQLSSVLSNIDFSVNETEQEILALATWLHDLGKATATTITTPDGTRPWHEPGPMGKIQSVGHENPEHYLPLLRRLKTSASLKVVELYLRNQNLINFLIENHMQLYGGSFSAPLIAKYFVNGKIQNVPEMKLLLILMWADKMGRQPESVILKGLQKNIEALNLSATKASQRDTRMANQTKAFGGSPQEFTQLLKSRGLAPSQKQQALKNKFPMLSDEEVAKLVSEGFRNFVQKITKQPTVIPADIPVSKDAMIIANALKFNKPPKSGFTTMWERLLAKPVEVYMVGGAVRDWLYHQYNDKSGQPFKPKDEDLTTNLSEKEVLEKLRMPHAVQAGIRVKEKESVDTFGVVFASVNGGPAVEIAPFRIDVGVADGRRPERIKQGTIYDDAMRRDLTMNNLYYDFYNKRILDFNPQGQGIEDVKQGIARPVGDPSQRFEEDKLRVLRLVRFFSRFNAGSAKQILDQRTLASVEKFKQLHQHGITPERIQMEFLAGIKQSQNTSAYLNNLAELDLYQTLFPSMNVDVQNISRLGNSKNPRVVMAWLLRKNQNVWNHLNNLKYSNEISDPVDFLINAMNLGTENALDVVKSRDKRLIRVGKKKTTLAPEDEQRNQQIMQEIQGDLAELSRVIGTNMTASEQPQMDRLQHLASYNPVQVSGEELMRSGLKGAAIGAEQKRQGEEHYQNSFQDFLRQKTLRPTNQPVQ